MVVLARHFAATYVREYGLAPAEFSPEAEEWLQHYDWPGNVRELQNLMERAVLLAGGRPITTRHFLLDPDNWPLFEEGDLDSGGEDGGAVAPAGADGVGDASTLSVDGGQAGGPDVASFPGGVIPLHEMERIMILKGLEVTSGNRTQAAELLGISVRTLRNKLNEYRGMGIEVA